MSSYNERYLTFSKPFIDSIRDIYKTMLATDVTAGKPTIKNDSLALGDYTSIMGLNGSLETEGNKILFKGSLIISWPMETYLQAASCMLMETYTEFKDEIGDVGCEIANMSMGNAKKNLVNFGYKIDMSIPTALLGRSKKIRQDGQSVSILIPFKCTHGDFYMEINYTEI